MRTVPLAQAPNQSFTATLDDVRWVVRLTTGKGVMACDVTRAGVTVLTGARALAGEPLIPYKYLETGNFIFVVNDGDLPDYRLFNVSQFLVYLSAADIALVQPISFGDIAAAVVPQYLTSDDGFYLTTDSGALLTNE